MNLQFPLINTCFLLIVLIGEGGVAPGDPIHNSTTQSSRYPPLSMAERLDDIPCVINRYLVARRARSKASFLQDFFPPYEIKNAFNDGFDLRC